MILPQPKLERHLGGIKDLVDDYVATVCFKKPPTPAISMKAMQGSFSAVSQPPPPTNSPIFTSPLSLDKEQSPQDENSASTLAPTSQSDESSVETTVASSSSVEEEVRKLQMQSSSTGTDQEDLSQTEVQLKEAVDDEVVAPFTNQKDIWDFTELDISHNYDLYILRWETELQIELGKSVLSLLSTLRDAVATHLVAYTALAALASAVILPYSLARFTDIIDSTWTIAVERADMAGEMKFLI